MDIRQGRFRIVLGALALTCGNALSQQQRAVPSKQLLLPVGVWAATLIVSEARPRLVRMNMQIQLAPAQRPRMAITMYHPWSELPPGD